MRLFTVLLLHLLFSATINNVQAQQPEPVYGIAKQYKPVEWYKKQALLWKQEVENHPANPMAWKYYYQANRNILAVNNNDTKSMIDGMTDSLAGIVEKMGKAIPNTFEYNHIMYYNGSYKADRSQYFPYLLKAYEIDSTRTEIYNDLIVYAEVKGDAAERKKYVTKQYNANMITPGHLNWCYNMLQSVEKNAVLFTAGDNDTYPVWALQDVKGIRPDVKMVNISLFMLEDYRRIVCKDLGIPYIDVDELASKGYNEMMSRIGELLVQNITKRPVYFAVSVSDTYYKKFEDSMYMEGLAMRFSPKKYDNVAVLKKNVEEKFMLDYLNVDFTNQISADLVAYSNANYIAPFITLYNYYEEKGEKKATTHYKSMILAIATKANMEGEVKKYFDNK